MDHNQNQPEALKHLDVLQWNRVRSRAFQDEQFAADEKTAFAVVRCLEILGEAARKIPESIRTRYPQVPWREMTGMRDILIHY